MTAGGQTHALAPPFLVFATQNPIEQEGTYPAARGAARSLHVPGRRRLPVGGRGGGHRQAADERLSADHCARCSRPSASLALQELVLRVPVADHVVRYAVALVRATRPAESTLPFVKENVAFGAGPRASQFLILGAKAKAILEGRPAARHRRRARAGAADACSTASSPTSTPRPRASGRAPSSIACSRACVPRRRAPELLSMSQILDPVALARLKNLELRARSVVEGALSGMHRSPHHGSSVEFAEHKEYAARRRDQAHRLEGVRQVRQVLRQALRGGDRAARLSAARLLGVDGLSRRRRLEARVRAHAGGVAGVLIVAAAGSSGHGRLRRAAARLSAAALALGAPERSADRARRRRAPKGAPTCRAPSPICPRWCSGARSSCSSAICSAAGDDVRHLLRGLRARKHDVVVFHLLDHDELTLPFEGTTIFESMEDDGKLLADPGDVRKAYLAELDRFVEGYRTALRRRRRRVSPRRHRASRRPRCCVRFLTGAYRTRGGQAMRTVADELRSRLAYVFLTLLFAVPIAIHLIGRSRAKVRRFAALELLLRGEQRVARAHQDPRSGCCSLLRALAIAAVPLILAKPFVEAVSDDLPVTAVGGAQSAVIVIDDSMSMSAEQRRPAARRGGARARAAHRRGARRRLRRGRRAGLARRRRAGAAAHRRSRQARARHHRRAADLSRNRRNRRAQARGADPRRRGAPRAARLPHRRIWRRTASAREPPWAAGRGPELVPIDLTDGKPIANRAIVDAHAPSRRRTSARAACASRSTSPTSAPSRSRSCRSPCASTARR